LAEHEHGRLQLLHLAEDGRQLGPLDHKRLHLHLTHSSGFSFGLDDIGRDTVMHEHALPITGACIHCSTQWLKYIEKNYCLTL